MPHSIRRSVVMSLAVSCLAITGADSVRANLSLAVGTEAGVAGQMRAFDGDGNVVLDLFPYGIVYDGGVRVAVGDLNGDGIPDVVTGAGAGFGGGHVKVFDGVTGMQLKSFFAYHPGFTGGVRVATGDINGDGRADIITGADARIDHPGTAHIKVFDGVADGQLLSFFAYPPAFLGGVRVAAGDINGDGAAEIIAGAGLGGPSQVKVFDGATEAVLQNFLAFGAGLLDGVEVASGDLNGDGLAEIVAGAGAGNGHVKVFDGASGNVLSSFFSFFGSPGGVRVATGDFNGDGLPDLATALDHEESGEVKFYSPQGDFISSFQPFGPRYRGGLFIAGAAVPEPSTLQLLLLSCCFIGTIRRRRAV